MSTYTSRAVQIDALRYDAPTDDTSDGNLDALNTYAATDGVSLVKQEPWNPADGQACLVMWRLGTPDGEGGILPLDPPAETPFGLLLPGGYLVNYADGLVAVSAADFEAEYDITTEQDPAQPAPPSPVELTVE